MSDQSKLPVYLKRGFFLMALLIFIAWLLAPLYQFMAYKDKLPILFSDFTKLPVASPVEQKVHHPEYEVAGSQTIELLTEHRLKINAPAISAAVSVDGKPVWSGAIGWADIEENKAVSTNTQFRIGSTSKALTGTALARLVDRNIINLDTPIVDYYSALPNDDWQNITARQLASHTAGLPHYPDNTDYLGLYRTLSLNTYFEDVKDSLSIFDGSDLMFEPGTHFHYSSFGTVLLSAVMQEAANTSYMQLMESEVFKPAGMNASMRESKARDTQNLANFYFNHKGTSNRVAKWRDVDLSHRLAGGGLVSTSTDLVKLGAAFLDEQFLSEQTRAEFWQPQTLPDGSLLGESDYYALGWRVSNYQWEDDSGLFMHHGGVTRGAQSWLMVLPKHKLAVAININSNTDVFWDFATISMDIAKVFAAIRKERFTKKDNSYE